MALNEVEGVQPSRQRLACIGLWPALWVESHRKQACTCQAHCGKKEACTIFSKSGDPAFASLPVCNICLLACCHCVFLQNPTQDAVIDPVRGVTKKEGHSPGHKIQMRTSEQVRERGQVLGGIALYSQHASLLPL